MKKYTIVAYPDEDGYPRKETTVFAENQEKAKALGWRLFPEYHEVGAFEVCD